MPNITITMREPRRSEDGLSIMAKGSSQSVSQEFGGYLVQIGAAVDTNNALAGEPDQLTRDEVVTVRGVVSGAGKRAAGAHLNSGFITQNALTAVTSHWAFVAPAPFYAIRLRLLNASAAAQLAVIAKVAASSNATDPTNPNADANWKAVTWAGAGTINTLAALSGAATSDVVPGVVASDVIACGSIARSDGTGYVAMARAFIPAAGNTNTSSTPSGLNPANLTDYDVSSAIIASDRVTTTAGTGWTASASAFPVVPEFFFAVPVATVLAAGDSTIQGADGALGSGGVWGGLRVAARTLQQAGAPVQPINAGASSMTSTAYFINGKTWVTAFRPGIAAYCPWSPNDTDRYTQAGVDRMLSQMVQWVDHCSQNGAIPALVTPCPASSMTAPQEAFRLQVVAAAKAMCAGGGVLLIDRDSIYTDYTTGTGGWKAGLNATTLHPNATGYALEAALWVSAIRAAGL